MIKPRYLLRRSKTIVAMLIASLLFQCTDDNVQKEEDNLSHEIAAQTYESPVDCSICDYVVPSSTKAQIVDAYKLGLSPGSTICLSSANIYSAIIFRNVVGTGAEPIIITNCGGEAVIDGTGYGYTVKTELSKFFRIKGGSGSTYGIKIKGGRMGIQLEKLSTNFEVNNVEIFDVGFAGIMAKTEPTCDDATIRGNFVMKNVSLHDNYVHDTGGEGFYIGHSFYEKGRTLSCGVRLPHEIDGLKIYNNRIDRAGWEAIQVGCAINGVSVFKNKIKDYGYANEPYQNNGIQFSEGSKSICYQNWVENGPGMGINVVGYGDSFIHNNVILNAGNFGIFCDERATRDLPGFRILNNTIVNPGQDGIRMYNEYVPGVIFNNIIVKPGSYYSYVYPRKAEDAFVYKLNKSIPLEMSNNLFAVEIDSLKFKYPTFFNYRLTEMSPAKDAGLDVAAFGMVRDYYGNPRLNGTCIDIGAAEY